MRDGGFLRSVFLRWLARSQGQKKSQARKEPMQPSSLYETWYETMQWTIFDRDRLNCSTVKDQVRWSAILVRNVAFNVCIHCVPFVLFLLGEFSSRCSHHYSSHFTIPNITDRQIDSFRYVSLVCMHVFIVSSYDRIAFARYDLIALFLEYLLSRHSHAIHIHLKIFLRIIIPCDV